MRAYAAVVDIRSGASPRPWTVTSYGPSAVLIETRDSLVPVLAATAAAHRERGVLPATAEIVAGARTVLIDGVDATAQLCAQIAGWEPVGIQSARGDAVEIPVVYDGADLADVAVRWGMTQAEVRSTHTALEFTVAFLGFAPGFAYLSGLPADLAVPRLARPRERVPAGAVALADSYGAVYPHATPGGWRLLGTTTAALWDLRRDPPALLTTGTRVRFVDVTETRSGHPIRPSRSPSDDRSGVERERTV